MSTKSTEKPGMDRYRAALLRIYPRSEKMRDYCESTVEEIVTLDNGMFFILEKQKIVTDFCFGYSLSRYDAEDFHRANRCVDKALEDQERFVLENLRHYENLLSSLRDDSFVPVLRNRYDVRESTDLKSLDFIQYWPWELILRQQDARDAEAEDRPKNPAYYVLTESDIARTEAAVKNVMARHEKKVRAYLKRYGLSKVRAWSYWQDA